MGTCSVKLNPTTTTTTTNNNNNNNNKVKDSWQINKVSSQEADHSPPSTE
jgi:hypothetical protein